MEFKRLAVLMPPGVRFARRDPVDDIEAVDRVLAGMPRRKTFYRAYEIIVATPPETSRVRPGRSVRARSEIRKTRVEILS